MKSPVRRNASGDGPASVGIGAQRCSRIETVARATCGIAAKCRASTIANASTGPLRCSWAKAYTVFFIVSVAITLALSPSMWAAAKSPSSAIATVRSRIRLRSGSRTILTRRIAALP